jgi:CubicO group peptidase (beta-lactamase class C family)
LLAVLLALLACAPQRTESSPPTVPPERAPQITVRDVPPAKFADPDRRKKIEAQLPAIRELARARREADGIVGLAIGIVVDGDLVLAEGFGKRHAEQGGDVDAHTAFRIGSITKVLTAMAVLRLHAEGRIDIDRPAAAYLPELHGLVYPTADARRVTVRDLLMHQAGLPRDPDLPELVPERTPTREELMLAVDGLALVRPPGSANEYSNLGFSLLGHLVARASGRPYHDEIRKEVLDPLGMRETVWEPEDVPAERRATGHWVEDGRIVARVPNRHGALDAAGGLHSTVHDLARLVSFQLAAWPGDSRPERGPLPRALVRDSQLLGSIRGFRAGKVPVEEAASGVTGNASGGGLGWGVGHGCDFGYVVGHNGSTDGFYATIRMLPHAGVGVVVLANSFWADTDDIANRILRQLDAGRALSARTYEPLPAVADAAHEVTRLLERRDDTALAAMLVPGLATKVDRFATRLRWLHDRLGRCELGEPVGAPSPWAGVFAMRCERGRAELTVRVTTAKAPRVQELLLRALEGEPEPAVRAAAERAASLIGRFDPNVFRTTFSPAFGRVGAERFFARMRFELGACAIERAVEVAGADAAGFALRCDRGSAKMTLALDRGEPARIESFNVIPADTGQRCR